MHFDAAGRASISENLKRFKSAHLHNHGLKHAAVCLIVVDDGQGRSALVLTRRAHHLRAHAGQWALPGGRLDAGETPAQGARREAREEIGLDLPEDAILGHLDDYATRSGYVITPVVAWAPQGAAMTANPAEVAMIFRIRLDELRRDKPEFFAIPESDRHVIRYPLRGKFVHAPTAAVMFQFIEVALEGRATRVAHLEQPVWAWR